MNPKKVRAALRKHFGDAGFAEDGPRFVRQSQELTHCVEVTAVRGLTGSIQIHHHVSLKGQTRPLLSEELASHGHNSTFPRIWSAESVDERLVLDQVTAIYRSFQTRQDLVHFFSDRYQRSDELTLPDTLPPAPLNCLSAAESASVLQRLAREMLNEDFSLVPREAEFEIWWYKKEVDGYRHCVYLEPNYSSTLAVLVTFALPAQAIAGGLRSENARRRLMVTPKQIFFSDGRPLLLPISTPSPNAYFQVRTELNGLLQLHPPHLLPR